MRKLGIAASTATLTALFLAAVPAFADQEPLSNEALIDWRLVIILSVLMVLAFHAVLELANRGR